MGIQRDFSHEVIPALRAIRYEKEKNIG